MGTVKNLREVLRNLDVTAVAVKSVSDTTGSYADLNAEQMSQGLRADGKEIIPSYRPLTIRMKQLFGKGLGSITDRVTLYNEGDFYKGIRTDVKGLNVVTTSEDPKRQGLEEKYGDIFGLSPRFKQEYVEEYLRPYWKFLIEQETGLKLK
ncbi:MAG: hypothetical protein KF862_07210 [Chitinophagaceae bacterium]|nr:hypothetical protein [Chitinophagaceae bacterium]